MKSNNEEPKKFSNEIKKHFLEIVSTYNKYQEQMDRKSDITKIAETLGGITEAACELAVNEGDDWFDKHTVKRNMSELTKLGQQFDKVAVESKSLDQRLAGLYEDMGHILSRYYKIGEISESEMKTRLGMNEDKDQAQQTSSKFEDLLGALNSVITNTYINDKEISTLSKIRDVIFKMSHSSAKRITNKSVVNEGISFTKQQLDTLREKYSTIQKINPSNPAYKKLTTFLDTLPKHALQQLIDAKIPFLAGLARNRVKKAKDESITEAKKVPTKQEIIDYLVKHGNNPNNAKKIVDKQYAHVISAWKDSSLRHMADVVSTLGLDEQFESLMVNSINEGGMSDIDVIRQESKTLAIFIKDVLKSYPKLKKDKGTIEWLTDLYNNPMSEATHGYEQSDHVTKHNDEYKLAQQLVKKSGKNEMKFYDELEAIHEKLGHPKYMKWLSAALRGYNVDMYRDSKIKNQSEAEEALFILSK